MKDALKIFNGQWITTNEFSQAETIDLPVKNNDIVAKNNVQNKHILFRKKFTLSTFKKAIINISADDYYKLYVNGKFAGMGPAPAYTFHYYYDEIDITDLLVEGENTIAIHTYYQGLVNRVWVSGDMRHGLILDLDIDGKTFLSSDDSFCTMEHSAYVNCGVCGYDTQFLENYNSNSLEVGFEQASFDDSLWEKAVITNRSRELYHTYIPQLVCEHISPKINKKTNNRFFIDFGSCYVGYLYIKAQGGKGDIITVRCGQELNDDGTVRYNLRANCDYEEQWILSGNIDTLDWFDYKSFRYVELIVTNDFEITDISLIARHYPVHIIMQPNTKNKDLLKVWDLCTNSLKYGVQENIMDCMEREKGQYVGDGVYTASTLSVLTGDVSMLEKLIAEACRSRKFERGVLTCTSCAYSQEIAEYPLMLPWAMCVHWALKKDKSFIEKYIDDMTDMLDYFCEKYEKYEVGILYDLDKWCVIDWPEDSRDNYDFETFQSKITEGTHNVISAYYIGAIITVNRLLKEIGRERYKDVKSMIKNFNKAFYDEQDYIYRDSKKSFHSSIPGNVLPVIFGFNKSPEFKNNAFKMFNERGIKNINIFMTFPLLVAAKQNHDIRLLHSLIGDKNAWLRMIDEGATTTFEAFSKDLKWNTSLFHLAFSYAAMFLTDFDDEIFHPQ